MKKIIVFMLCAVLIFALPVVAYAEDGGSTTDEQNGVVTENLTTENETATEGEILPPEKTVTESIAEYVQEKLPEIAILLVSLAMTAFITHLKNKLTTSMAVMNNNNISVATSSAEAVNKALTRIEELSGAVEEIRKTAEEKEAIEQMLLQVDAHLKTAKLANVEFANELAELLNLANIPNSKKNEMYARHTKSVHELEAVEEVMSHDGKEA